MATQCFLRSGIATAHRGDLSNNLAGSVVGWTPGILSTSRGSPAVNITVSTVAGPTSGVEFAGTGAREWLSDPIDQDVTISGTITFNLWAYEGNMSANAGLHVVIERLNSQMATVSTIVSSERGSELAVGPPTAVNNWTLAATSTNMLKGDRFRVRVAINDVGTMASGYSTTFSYNGATAAADGDSYVTFAETFGFQTTAPSGSTLYLTDTASDVGTASTVDREAWTSRGDGVNTDVTNTATGPISSPGIQVTDTAGGTAVEWYTKKLQAFTLGGVVSANIRGLESSAGMNASLCCEIAVCNSDGSSPTVWGSACLVRGGSLELDVSEAACTGFVSGDDVSVTDGQRLRIRVYLEDASAVEMQSGGTVTTYYDGTTAAASGDTYITLPQTVSEQVAVATSRSRLHFKCRAGAADSAVVGAKSFVITTSGGGWTATDDAAWLTVTASGSSGGTLTASVDASALSAGTYTATITVTSGSSVNVPVILFVTATSSAPSDAGGALMHGHNPVLWWRMDETSGNLVSREGGISVNAMGANVTYSQTALINTGTAIEFNVGGSVGYAQILDADSYRIAGAFTFMWWINPVSLDTSGVVQDLFEKGSNWRVRFTQDAANQLVVTVYLVGTQTIVTTVNGITNNKQMLVVTYDRAITDAAGTDAVRVYVDGSLAGQCNSTQEGDVRGTASSLYLANFGTGGGNGFSGVVDEVAMLNYALNATQISDLYNAYSGIHTATPADTLTIADSLSFVIGRAVTPADTLTVADGQALLQTVQRSFPETLTISGSDVLTLSNGFNRTLPETLTVADLASQQSGKEITLPDTLTIADANRFDFGEALADTMTVADAERADVGKALADAITIADLADPQWSPGGTDHTVPLADPLGVADALRFDHGEALADALGITDQQALQTTTFRDFADSLGVTDALRFDHDEALADAISISDQQALLQTVQRALADNLTVADQTVLSIVAALADNLTLADQQAFLRTVELVFPETLGIADLATPVLGGGAAHEVPLSDTLTVADLVAAQNETYRTLTDTLTVADAVGLDVSKLLADAIAVADQATPATGWDRVLADNLGITDSERADVGKTLADAIAIADQQALLWTAQLAFPEALSVADVATPLLGGGAPLTQSLSDTLAVADSLAALTTWQRSFADPLGITDASLREVSKTLADSLTITDARSFEVGKGLTEALTIADLFSRTTQTLLALPEALTISDQFASQLTGFQSLADTLVITDARRFDIEKALADAISISDQLALTRSSEIAFADTLALIDLFDRTHQAQREFTELLVITDVAIVFRVSALLMRLRIRDRALTDALLNDRVLTHARIDARTLTRLELP